jgi:hypothetical protein
MVQDQRSLTLAEIGEATSAFELADAVIAALHAGNTADDVALAAGLSVEAIQRLCRDNQNSSLIKELRRCAG